MKPNDAFAHVRQLCSLGLGGEAIMPALLDAVRIVVPAEAAVFFWVDSRCEIRNTYFSWQFDPDLGRLYFLEFYNRRELEFGPGFSAAVRAQYGVGGLQHRFMTKRFFASDLYNVIWRPQSLHDSVDCVLRDGERCVGVLQLFRPPRSRPFTARDLGHLERLAPYVTHGVTAKPDVESALASGDESGMLIADAHGRLVHASPLGRRLLFLSTHAPFSVATAGKDDSRLPDFLMRVCADVVGIRSGFLRPPPVLRRRNCWGEFVFRAYALRNLLASEGNFVGVTVERLEPVLVKLARTMRELPLSARQREVCLLLAQGCSHDEVGRRMGIKPNTAIDHVRKIYAKLGVHERGQLLRKLTSEAE